MFFDNYRKIIKNGSTLLFFCGHKGLEVEVIHGALDIGLIHETLFEWMVAEVWIALLDTHRVNINPPTFGCPIDKALRSVIDLDNQDSRLAILKNNRKFTVSVAPVPAVSCASGSLSLDSCS